MAQKLSSYDIPQALRDRINAMNDDEIRALQLDVKAPARCAAGDPDLTVWWACENALRGTGVTRKRNPLGLSDGGYASLNQMLRETKIALPSSEIREADLNSD